MEHQVAVDAVGTGCVRVCSMLEQGSPGTQPGVLGAFSLLSSFNYEPVTKAPRSAATHHTLRRGGGGGRSKPSVSSWRHASITSTTSQVDPLLPRARPLELALSSDFYLIMSLPSFMYLQISFILYPCFVVVSWLERIFHLFFSNSLLQHFLYFSVLCLVFSGNF